MERTATILHLSHPQINKQRWDECIQQSNASLIYAHSFYLDNIAPGWNAIIANDYSWVLPLTHRRKLGFTYLYQPAFTQQLGVFAKPGVLVPWTDILVCMQQQYSFCEVNWNFTTPAEALKEVITSTATNLIVDLSASFDVIASGFSKDLQRNVKRATRFGFAYEPTSDYATCIKLYHLHYGSRIPHVIEKDYKAFHRVCTHAAQNGMLYCRQAINEQGDVLAIALLLFDGKRLYNMMNTTTELGRKTEANHFLLESIIREFSGRNMLFDFEGSDLPGVKRFYEQFSQVNQPYYSLRYNALPRPLRWLKQ